jgi:AcrR family transcriptional regulator
MRPALDHRQTILRTAAHLFAQRPFHEVLMEDVAVAAGIAKGTIYRFYENKEQLYAAICLESLDRLRGELRAKAGAPEAARVRLTRMVRCVVEHFRAQRDFFNVMQREWAGVCPTRRTEFLVRRAAARAVFARVIRVGRQAGEFREVNDLAAADMLLGMIRSLVRFGNPRLGSAALTAAVLDVFENGVARAGERRKGNGR